MTATANSELDGFLTLPQIAQLEGGVTTRTMRNRIAQGTFPREDARRDGVPLWLQSTYRAYQRAVLEGRYAGRDRLAHLRKTERSSAA